MKPLSLLPFLSAMVLLGLPWLVPGLPVQGVWAQNSPLRFVDQEDPVYALLDREYTLGHLKALPQVKPWTRKDIAALLQEALAAREAKSPAPGQKAPDQGPRTRLEAALKRMKSTAVLAGTSPEAEFRANMDIKGSLGAWLPVARLGDSQVDLVPQVEINIDAGEVVHLSLNQDLGASLYGWSQEPWFYYDQPLLADNIFNAVNLQTGETSSNSYDFHSPGEGEFVYFANTFSQLVVELDPAILAFGRGSPSWGPGLMGQLALSTSAKAYEYISVYLPVDTTFSYTWITAFMRDITDITGEDTGAKLLSGHRLDFQLTEGLDMSLYETVVYGSRFELAYLSPLSPYFISEVRLGDYDNKFGGFDLRLRLAPVQIWLGMLIDDWWAEDLLSFNGVKNTYGLQLGAAVADLAPDLHMGLECAYLSHWLYTHRGDLADAANRHNSYANFSTPIGLPLDPNTLAITQRTTWDASPGITLNLDLMLAFHGTGPEEYPYDIDHPYDFAAIQSYYGVDSEAELSYPFLDIGIFPLQTIFSAWLDIRIDLVPEQVVLDAGIGFECKDTENDDQAISFDPLIKLALNLLHL